MASLYVHFPWCLAKCPYCDFVSYKTERDAIPHDAYGQAVVREIAFRSHLLNGKIVGSIFFGGGTPSLWDPSVIGRIIAFATRTLDCAKDIEITVECNPTSLDRARAAELAQAGVGRLSIGAQALGADQLAFLGRLHGPEGALDAIDAALSVPQVRVSADLIFGLPGQTPEDAAKQADRLASRGLLHLSCYQLTIEPGTRFGELARVGRLPRADDGLVAESFLAVHDALTHRGLEHYEISNYARPGHEARHNLAYWRGEEYLGVGCAAYGFVRENGSGVRWRNHIDPSKYIQSTDPTMTREPLSPEQLLKERIMLGLRLASGLDLGEAGRDLGVDPWTPERVRTIEALVGRGRLVREGPRLRIPPEAWLFADDTIARLF